MADPFDEFNREMKWRSVQAAQQDAAAKQSKPQFSERDKQDRAVVSAMKSIPLRRGQMLLLGPKSVAILSGLTPFTGTLPDKLVIEKSEWNSCHS